MEPWAALIVQGFKPVENRTWRAHHYGRLVICASQKIDLDGDYPQTSWLGIRDHMHTEECPLPFHYADLAMCPGYAVGMVEVEEYDREKKTRWDCHGQWHWRLSHPVKFKCPFPYSGKLGLFDVPTVMVYDAVGAELQADLFPNYQRSGNDVYRTR